MAVAKHAKVEEFLERRKANPKSIVIDVRDDDKYDAGHIPGAINIHKTVIQEETVSQVPDKNAEIFCHCGGGTSGQKAAEALAKMGYKNVSVIDGGFRLYNASGAPIKK